MNFIIDPKYGNTIKSEMFGCTFFLIPSYSEKYKMMQYSLFSAPTFKDGSSIGIGKFLLPSGIPILLLLNKK